MLTMLLLLKRPLLLPPPVLPPPPEPPSGPGVPSPLEARALALSRACRPAAASKDSLRVLARARQISSSWHQKHFGDVGIETQRRSP